MDLKRQIDEASSTDEVIYWALQAPLSQSDRVLEELWNRRDSVLELTQPVSKFDRISKRTGSQWLSGPHGIIGPVGLIAFVVAMPIGWWTVNFAWFVVGFALAFLAISFAIVRTTPRWTPTRISETSLSPSQAGRLSAWLLSQNPDLELTEQLVAGILDSTDYYREIVVVVLERDLENAHKIATEVLAIKPLAVPWLWRFAPSVSLATQVASDATDVHWVGLVQLFSALPYDELAPAIPETGTAREAFDSVYVERRTPQRETRPGLNDEKRIWDMKPGGSEIPNWDRLVSSPHPLALQVIDMWRRTPDSSISWTAQNALQQAVHNQTGTVPSGDVVALLDRVLFPLTEESEYADEICEAFFARRENDLIQQDRIPLDTFAQFHCTPLNRHVLWGTFKGNALRELFRIDETFDLIRLDDSPFTWEPHVEVGIVHPLQIPDRMREAWQLVFAEYELLGFDQLSRLTIPSPELFHLVQDVQVSEEEFFETLGAMGWNGDLFNDPRVSRTFRWDGEFEKAVIEFHDGRASLAFWSIQGPSSVRLKKPMTEVHRVIVSESIRALKLASTKEEL